MNQDPLKQQWHDKCKLKHVECVAATQKVPKIVLAGSYQTAKAWKALAAKVNAEKHPAGQSSHDVDQLQNLYHLRCRQLEQLKGEAPL